MKMLGNCSLNFLWFVDNTLHNVSLSLLLCFSLIQSFHLICLYHSNLSHFMLTSLSHSTLVLSLSHLLISQFNSSSTIALFLSFKCSIDLSIGTAAFLLISNLQDLLTKLLANTGSEYNFNCLATRKHENTKLSDRKF